LDTDVKLVQLTTNKDTRDDITGHHVGPFICVDLFVCIGNSIIYSDPQWTQQAIVIIIYLYKKG